MAERGRRIVSGLGHVWATASAARVALYRHGWLPTRALDRPTVSIGALEMGGTGKTPCTAALAGLLHEAGHRIAILSRGYGRRSSGPLRVSLGDGPLVDAREAGDEPWGYARGLPGVAVAVAARREQAAAVLSGGFEPDLYLLDDAFQHVRVTRDLDLLAVDSDLPFWNGQPPPGGRLREGVGAAARADGFLVIGPRSEECRRELGRRFPGRPVFGLRREYPGALALSAWLGGAESSTMPPGPVFAFAGIARPQRFFDALTLAGITIAGNRSFRDHHWYDAADLQQLAEDAASRSAALITTEKDASRLARLSSLPPDLYVWPQRLEPHEPAALLEWIGRRLAGARA